MTIAASSYERSPDLTVVIPTYNERERIDLLLARVFAACERDGLAVEVVIVDDNSADGTGVIADEWTNRRPVRVIHRAGKLGLGSAVLEGFAIARAEIVGVMDGDLSHPPELLPRLFRAIGRANADMAVASRYVDGGRTSLWSSGRLLLSRMGCALARMLTPVHDAMSGFFLIRRARLDNFRTSARGFKIGLELLVRSKPRRLVEIGYPFVGRSVGASKMSFAEAVGFLRQLLSLYIFSMRTAIGRPAYVTLTDDVRASVDPDPVAVASAPARQRLDAKMTPTTATGLQRAQSQEHRRPY